MKKVTFGAKPTVPHGTADNWVVARPSPAEPVKRLTIDIPVSLHRRVKTGGVLENLVMADVVRDLLDRRFPATQESVPAPGIAAADTETQKDGSP